jgi:hypothetical protein
VRVNTGMNGSTILHGYDFLVRVFCLLERFLIKENYFKIENIVILFANLQALRKTGNYV